MDYRGVALIAHTVHLQADAKTLNPGIEILNDTDAKVELLRPRLLLHGKMIDPIPDGESGSPSFAVPAHERVTSPYTWPLPDPVAASLKDGAVVEFQVSIEDESFSTSLVLLP